METQQLYKNILENIYDGVYFVDKDRKITFWNKGAERITGYSASEVMDKYCYNNILNHVNDYGIELCLSECPLYKTIEDGTMRDVSVYLHHKQGHRIPVSVRSIAILEGNERIGAVEVFKDDSEKFEIYKNMEELKYLSLYDKLTELPNRRYIDNFLSSKMNEYYSLGIPFGIAFIDIDKFKDFNDNFGHDMGDEVLKMVSKTLRKNVRTVDLIGRWGGEEFLAIFSGIDKKSLLKKSEKIRLLTEKSRINKNGQEFKVTISIGATEFKQNDNIQTILKRADNLLYMSKTNGRNKVTID